MANNKEQNPEEQNEDSIPDNEGAEGLSAQEAAESVYDENDVWKRSRKFIYFIVGLIVIIVSANTYFSYQKNKDTSERSYRFLSASIDSEGAESRFLSFAEDYDDTLGSVALYRAAVLQYKDKRYSDAAKNFELAAKELNNNPLVGRALLGQAVSLIKANSEKVADGKILLEDLAGGENFLPNDRREARFLLALQSLSENDMDSVTFHKELLSKDQNASYFLGRLDELLKTNKFLEVSKSLPDLNLEKGQSFLNENSKLEGVKTLESGLQYLVISNGNGKKPDINDTVEVHYQGSLISGEIFDSSLESAEPVSFAVNGVIKGWTEALQIMSVGDKWKLFIPSDLAYGETGNNSIGPNETLIFEVELIGIAEKVIPEPKPNVSLTDLNSSAAEAPILVPQLDENESLFQADKNSSVSSELNSSE